MKRLNPMDAVFLNMETKRATMHIGCLTVFKLPKKRSRDYLKKLVDQMRNQPFLPEPFDSKLAQGGLAKLRPAWVKAEEMDMEYHVRHSAMPAPGNLRDLGVLVSRLHSNQLDFDKPLWEAHVIEGIEGRRFAIYFKAHHACIDGLGGMALTKAWLKSDPEDMSEPELPASIPRQEHHRKTLQLVEDALQQSTAAAKGFIDLAKGIWKMSRQENNMIKAARHTPKSLFNVHVGQQRRLGPLSIELKRFKDVSKALDVTVNDIALAIIGGGVRRYLIEMDALPEDSLTASVPIGLDRPDGQGGSAAAGFVTPIGTDLADPVERAKKIHASTTQCKADINALSREAQEQLALTGLAPLLLGQMTGTLPKLPPLFNFVVSNVVLTPHKLYLMGAELEAIFPMSFLFDGYALNVTLVGYGGNVAIGFIGCRDAIPSLQKLAIYTEQAMEELEQAAGLA